MQKLPHRLDRFRFTYFRSTGLTRKIYGCEWVFWILVFSDCFDHKIDRRRGINGSHFVKFRSLPGWKCNFRLFVLTSITSEAVTRRCSVNNIFSGCFCYMYLELAEPVTQRFSWNYSSYPEKFRKCHCKIFWTLLESLELWTLLEPLFK